MAKTLVVVDTQNSAMGISAHQYALHENTLVFAALDFASPDIFLRAIMRENVDVIIFVWRGVFFDLTKKKSTAILLENFRRRGQIFFVIADHLGLEPRYLKRESLHFHRADGYYTTNKMLFEEYSRLFVNFPPVGIYRDLPNIGEILKVQRNLPSRNPKKIIWVGNSKWGKNYGFVDHKGRREILNPLIGLLTKYDPSIEVKIIDSATGFVPNDIVLREIASAGILLQTSRSEGTGLPILEALALGTIPITSRVGIAEEVLTHRLIRSLVKRDPNDYLEAICVFLNTEVRRENLVEIFFNYANQCQFNLPSFHSAQESKGYNFSFFKSLRVAIIWKVRFLKPRAIRFLKKHNFIAYKG